MESNSLWIMADTSSGVMLGEGCVHLEQLHREVSNLHFLVNNGFVVVLQEKIY